MTARRQGLPPIPDRKELPSRCLVHDRDTSFATTDAVWNARELRVLKTPPHSPPYNAYVERRVREICATLDNLILLGQPCVHDARRAIQANYNTQ